MTDLTVGTNSIHKLLQADNLDSLAGQASQQCIICMSENLKSEVEVGPCFLREQILTGSSSPNSRVCVFASRRPLFSDLYPPYDMSVLEALQGAVNFVGREGDHQESFESFKESIRLGDPDFENVCESLRKHQVVVLKAPTGFGKSTWLPYRLCWDEKSQFSENFGKIIVAQPRKLAAESVAATVSQNHENRSPGPSNDVGLHHGETSQSGEANKLIFVTDGSLIKRLIDRDLNDVQLIVVDEAHERNERIELILLILRFLLPQYPHLRLLILSATIEPQQFVDYYKCDNPNFVPVEAAGITLEDAGSPYAEQAPKWGKHRSNGTEWRFHRENMGLCDLIEKVCSNVVKNDQLNPPNSRPGHVLVFLPGKQEIDMVERELVKRSRTTGDFKLVQLHGDLSVAERAKVVNFEPDPIFKRQIVLATNIAESSITVNDLVCVVDCGLSKSRSTNGRLEIRWITKAEQMQRRGRVNRNRLGIYYAFFSERNFDSLEALPGSQILIISQHQSELFVLRAMLAGLPPVLFGNDSSFLLSPLGLGKKMIEIVKHLKVVGAISGEWGAPYLTPIGVTAAATGTSVDVAELLVLGDLHNVLPEVASIAAAICVNRENDLFQTDMTPKSLGSVSNTRMPIESIVRDTYLLQSFDKSEAEPQMKTMTLLAKGDPRQYGTKQSDVRIQKLWARRLELCHEVANAFQERVPADRIREINPSLLHRAQLVVNAWTTKGWRRDVRILLGRGSEKPDAATMCAIFEGLVVMCDDASIESTEERLLGSDDLDIMFVCRADAGTQTISNTMDIILQDLDTSTQEPRHVIIESLRIGMLSPLPPTQVDSVDLELAGPKPSELQSPETRRTLRELEALVPELVAPPGSRWERDQLGRLIRDSAAETEAAEISDNQLEAHSLLVPVSDTSEDLPHDDEISSNARGERLAPPSCLWLDAINRQFGTTHAPMAKQVRHGASSEDWPLTIKSLISEDAENHSEFQVRRNEESQLCLVVDYLQSAVAQQIENSESLPFCVKKVIKEQAGGEVLFICKIEVQREPKKTSKMSVGAWQIFPEYPALAMQFDNPLLTSLAGFEIPPRLFEFGNHRLSSWKGGRRLFVVYDEWSVPRARQNLGDVLEPVEDEAPSDYYTRVKPSIEHFTELHQELRSVRELLK